ncbi:MAG: sporulation protein YqfD [Ruminococcus sp.]|nr:sporulation protein YqfD [Ruminococcus sp.]
MKLIQADRLRVNASGKDLYRFINAIHDSRIECLREYCRGGVLYCDIPRSDLNRLQKAAAEYGIELKTAEYDSLPARIRRYRKRTGLIIGAVLAAFIALCFSRVVVTIDIEGNSSVSDEAVLAALGELGVSEGTPLRSIDMKYCEEKLRTMVDGIAWAGMHRTGSRIAVQIREKVPAPEMVRGRVPCNVVASRDAEISAVIVKNGMLMHRVGDYVRKGTLLISGVRTNSHDRTFVDHAMGDIRGIYEEKVSFSGAFAAEVQVTTGRAEKRRSLSFFGLRIPLSLGESRFERSRSHISEKYLHIFGKELPIGILTERIAETVTALSELSEKELTDRLMERVYLYEKNFLADDTEILGREIAPRITEDGVTLDVTYRLEGSITEERDIFIDKLSARK